MELYSLRYLSRFHCIGAACQDNCCQGWAVTVDKPHYDRLRGRMSSPAERAELEAGMKRLTQPGQKEPRKNKPQEYALTVLRDDGTCSFLGADRLCSIHGRFGEDLLPDTCAIYPRILGQVGEHVELVAAASCPEVARLVLLEDDASDLVAGDPALIGRRSIDRRVDPKSKDPYDLSFFAIRALVISILEQRRYPLASRLFFVAYFAEETRDTLRRSAEAFDAETLQDLASRFRVPETFAVMHRGYQRTLADPAFAFAVIREMLGLPPPFLPPILAGLVDEIATALAAGGASLTGDPAALHRAYQALPPLAPELAARLDLILERYAIHDLMRTWYVKEASFIGYYHALLARMATVRFLAGSLARLRAPLDLTAFDALAVQIVYLLSRAIDHNGPLVKEIQRALEEHGLRFEHAVALTRV